MEDWVTIRNMKRRNPKLGTRKIADILGISRNTVRRALASDSAPQYQRAEQINREILPFKDYIYERYVIKKLRGSRILNDILSKGYKGSKSAFYRYLEKLERPAGRTYQRYETAPGEQAQFDWSPYSVLIDGELRKVVIFIYILGFSRYRVYEGSFSQTQACVFEALENSFHHTGGVPERMQTDNAKVFIDDCFSGKARYNARYLAFCEHYTFQPTRSLPGHPWSKGKVENPFSYLEDHFIQENRFASFEDFLSRLKAFQAEVNNKVHGTTNVPPQLLFEKEQPTLGILPKTRYVSVKEQSRKVSSDCLISFKGNRYSVPWMYAMKEVWVKESRGFFLEVYSAKNIQIAKHRMQRGKGKVIMDCKHYKNNKIEQNSWTALKQTFLEQFPEYEDFTEKLKAQKRINAPYHLKQILYIATFYDPNDIKDALEAALSYNTFTYTFIQGFLENNHHMRVELKRLDLKQRPSTEGIGEGIKRPLREYQNLLKQKEVEV